MTEADVYYDGKFIMQTQSINAEQGAGVAYENGKGVAYFEEMPPRIIIKTDVK